MCSGKVWTPSRTGVALTLVLPLVLALAACDRWTGAEGPGGGDGASQPPVPLAERAPAASACAFGRRPTPAAATGAATKRVRRVALRSEGLRLLTQSPAVVPGLAAAAPEPLARFGTDALAQWRQGDGRYRSPEFGAALRDAAIVTIALKGAHAVELVPFSVDGRGDDDDRQHRRATMSVPATGPQVVHFDLNDLLRHSWNDAARKGGLRALELVPRGDGAVIVGVQLHGPSARYPGASGQGEVERDGVVMPARYLRGGAKLSYALRAGAGRALRFHVASSAQRQSGHVAIHRRGAPSTKHSFVAGQQWQPRAVDLAAYSDQDIEVEFAFDALPGAQGEHAVGFVGEPRLVAVGTPPGPDVLVYLVDTLIATRLGAWGSPLAQEGISPTIDRLAAEGLTFGHALSTAPWTKPAIPSLLASVAASTHGVGSTSYTGKLARGVPLLHERFRDAGYRTGSFVANPLASTLSGLERGFAHAATPRHFRRTLGRLGHPSARALNDAALGWLDEERDQPHFIYMHTLEVHEYRNRMFRRGGSGWFPYDHAIADQDAALASLLRSMGERARDLVVVFLSDHGEAFDEHGHFGHGHSLYEPELHVPLLLWAPGRIPAGVVNRPVSIVDVAPTLLDLFGLPALPQQEGVSLLGYARGETQPPPRDLYASREWNHFRPDEPPHHALYAQAGGKAIVAGSRRLAFDLRRDPCELDPAGDASPVALDGLSAWLERKDALRAEFEATYGETRQAASVGSNLERLRALGYVE